MGNFLRHTIVYLFSDSVNRVLSLILVFILLKWLTPGQYGEITLFLSYFQLLNVITSLNLYRAVPIYLGNKREKENLGSIFTVISLNVLIIILIFLCISQYINIDSKIMLLLILSSGFYSYWSFYKEILIFEQKSITYAKYFNLSNLILFFSSIGLTYFIYKTHSSENNLGRIYGNISQTIALFFLVLAGIKNFKFGLNIKLIRYFMTLSLPLLLYSGSSVVLSYADRIMIEKITNDLSAVGVYSLSYNLGMFISVLSTAIINNYRVEYFKNVNKNNENINSLIRRVVVLMFFALIIMTVLFPPLLKFSIQMFQLNTGYLKATTATAYVFLGYYYLFLQSIFVMDFYHKESTLKLSLITIVAALINIILNYLLIPKFSFNGAAIATTISYLFLLVVTFFFNNNKLMFERKTLIYVLITVFLSALITLVYTII
ncbi:polysaccharide biosynthesis C-terminal domain-containing protein [Priestia megaterium]|uniref:oligosaccharide flippase family protein n=1 Tax=Priestia megaterium TaxID=1404 RepID=UPI0038A48E2C